MPARDRGGKGEILEEAADGLIERSSSSSILKAKSTLAEGKISKVASELAQIC